MKKLADINVCTERLKLIPLKLSDARKLSELSNYKEVTEKVDILKTPFTEEDAKKLLSRESGRDECFFGVFLKEDSTLVAVVGAHSDGHAVIEIGYWAHPAYKRKGYVSEAVKKLTTGIHQFYPDFKIIAECLPENLPSFLLLKKCGFISTGKVGHRPGREILIWRKQ
ncbi:GNAT family N-acetyltransferase [Pantoea stewartii]|uniref:GNAT family N-acetyltransferase n=1 Tax=Pantoea stewartii TaxID=66269 RepID=UPI00345BFF67